MEPSLFSKIISGEIPCHKIYEDEKTVAFLDIHPESPGHTLVVTKVQVDQYIDLADEDYMALWVAVKKVATHLKDVMQTDRVKVSIIGTDVPHVHVHLVPFNVGGPRNKNREAQEPNHAALAVMAEKLAF